MFKSVPRSGDTEPLSAGSASSPVVSHHARTTTWAHKNYLLLGAFVLLCLLPISDILIRIHEPSIQNIIPAISTSKQWTYSLSSDWGSLSPDYILCSTGTQQSPINLVGKPVGANLTHSAVFMYRASVSRKTWN